jgi:hypothetical protein
MISTRHLGCAYCENKENPEFQVMRYEPCDGWRDSSWQEWEAEAELPMLTAIYVHGNRIEWNEAFQRGLSAYRALVRCAPIDEPIRFVIWSWPSGQTCGLRRDLLAKAARSDSESYYLGLFLTGLPPETRVGLFGFSFGARIISGAMHLAAGGEMGGLCLPETPPTHTTRIALLAAAMHNYWWLPGRYHSECLAYADHALLLFNPCDPVLHWYPMLYRRYRPQALGYTGFPWVDQLADPSRLEQANVCCQVGRTHDVELYFASDWIMSQVSELLLW